MVTKLRIRMLSGFGLCVRLFNYIFKNLLIMILITFYIRVSGFSFPIQTKTFLTGRCFAEIGSVSPQMCHNLLEFKMARVNCYPSFPLLGYLTFLSVSVNDSVSQRPKIALQLSHFSCLRLSQSPFALSLELFLSPSAALAHSSLNR